MQQSKSTTTSSNNEHDFIQLQDFLNRSALSYTTYWRLRAQQKTPEEHKLTAKTILIRKAEAEAWLKNPPLLGSQKWEWPQQAH